MWQPTAGTELDESCAWLKEREEETAAAPSTASECQTPRPDIKQRLTNKEKKEAGEEEEEEDECGWNKKRRNSAAAGTCLRDEIITLFWGSGCRFGQRSSVVVHIREFYGVFVQWHGERFSAGSKCFIKSAAAKQHFLIQTPETESSPHRTWGLTSKISYQDALYADAWRNAECSTSHLFSIQCPCTVLFKMIILFI